jgi:adenine-specific DNA glycosylase
VAPDRRAWTAERTWAIKGVSDRTRAAALEAAHEAGLTVGEWVERVLARAAKEARHPRPAEIGTDVTELLNERLRPVEEELRRLAERLASLEGRIGREIRPEPADETAAPPSPAQEPQARERAETSPVHATPPRKTRGPRRELPEEARARIDELHGAGRSIYAISKELEVPYSTVYAHVKKSRGDQARA